MTGEEMERAIEIILHNQANFELQFEKTERQMEATIAQVEALAEQVGIVVEQVGIITERVETVADTQTAFIRTTIGHIEAQGEINASVRGMLRELKETTLDLKRSQTRTDKWLIRLADAVERHIREAHDENS
jgi:hypothetical protein